MTIEQAKQELVRRYRYLYENAYFILAPYMHEQTQEEYEKFVRKYGRILEKPLIYLNINRLDPINTLFEEFLLSDTPMEKSSLYQTVEGKRDNKEYLDKVKKGLALAEKKNKYRNIEYLDSGLDIWNILSSVFNYIKEQSGDLKNKKRKLYIIDQYCRLFRYKNDGHVYTSGKELDLHDCGFGVVLNLHEQKPKRSKEDIGVAKNSFIVAIVNTPTYEDNYCIFTENEKQQIYLEYHDELPCDLEITCEIEKEYPDMMFDTRLSRPEHTFPCKKSFTIKEEEIFINPDDVLYRYYQICPHCGFIVNIPKEILSEGIKQRIEERCSKDDMLFRKMILYSELFGLDNASTKEQKKLLKK